MGKKGKVQPDEYSFLDKQIAIADFVVSKRPKLDKIPTPKQAAMLDLMDRVDITDYTYIELANMMGYTHPAGIVRTLASLAHKGFLTKHGS